LCLRYCGRLLLSSSKQQQWHLTTINHYSMTTKTLTVICQFSSRTTFDVKSSALSPSPPAEAGAGGNPSRFWLNNLLTGRSQWPIFVTATTKQHVGKTTTCLALLRSGLKKGFNNVRFLKPVGQQHVDIVDNNNNQLHVDIKMSCWLRKSISILITSIMLHEPGHYPQQIVNDTLRWWWGNYIRKSKTWSRKATGTGCCW
jgi:hypothetical protein